MKTHHSSLTNVTASMSHPPHHGKQLTPRESKSNFKGLIAPVFTCFNDDDERSLSCEHIERYASWLKSKHINGVLVNSFAGECYAMTAHERMLHAEIWWKFAQKYELICMIYIGSAPYPEIIEAAKHAEELGVHAVVCTPDEFQKPQNTKQLVAYCANIALNCRTRPFFYDHSPNFTNVEINLQDFFNEAEKRIPNFYGVLYTSTGLDEGARCLRGGRRILLLNANSMLAAGFLMGFEAAAMICLNVCPDLCHQILKAIQANDLGSVKEKQHSLCDYVWSVTGSIDRYQQLADMKNWFNEKMSLDTGAGFSAGPTRNSF